MTATKATDVAYVTDERTCGKALTAFNTVMATPSLDFDAIMPAEVERKGKAAVAFGRRKD